MFFFHPFMFATAELAPEVFHVQIVRSAGAFFALAGVGVLAATAALTPAECFIAPHIAGSAIGRQNGFLIDVAIVDTLMIKLQHSFAKKCVVQGTHPVVDLDRSEEHTSELQSLMRISYAVFCLKKTN